MNELIVLEKSIVEHRFSIRVGSGEGFGVRGEVLKKKRAIIASEGQH